MAFLPICVGCETALKVADAQLVQVVPGLRTLNALGQEAAVGVIVLQNTIAIVL